MKEKIRIGIVGTGFGAKVHAPMFQHHLGYDVVAIASVSRGRLDEIRQQTGIEKVYGDWRKMLDQEQLDLVAVTSAPYLHHEMVIEALKRGCHILCEKPMAFDAEQTAEMIAARDQAGVLGFVNFEFRFRPVRRKIKSLLASGTIGQINHVRYRCNFLNYNTYANNRLGWIGQEELGGGMLGAIGSHMIDALLWWMNSPLKSVYAELPIHLPEWSNEEGEKETRTADDAFQVLGKFEGGATLSLEMTSALHHATNAWQLEIFGSEGTLIMTDDQTIQLGIGSEPLQEIDLMVPDLPAPPDMPAPANRYYNAFYPMMEHMYRSIAEGENNPLLPTFENGHQVQLILDAIRKSAREGKRILL